MLEVKQTSLFKIITIAFVHILLIYGVTQTVDYVELLIIYDQQNAINKMKYLQKQLLENNTYLKIRKH